MPKEAYNPECLIPTVKHGGRSVMIWAAISRYSAGPIITLNGWIAGSDYVDTLGKQVHPMFQLFFPNNDVIFLHYNWPIHTARSVRSWFEHEDALPKSFLASTMTRLKYHLTSVVSFRGYGEKQIPSSMISQATRWCSSWRAVQYSTTDYSEHIWVYSKKDTYCITGKWWPNSILIKKCVSLTAVSIILSIPWIPQSLDIGTFVIHRAMTVK